jgi:hypothetical protein
LIALIINAHPSSVRRLDPRRIPATRYVTAMADTNLHSHR